MKRDKRDKKSVYMCAFDLGFQRINMVMVVVEVDDILNIF